MSSRIDASVSLTGGAIQLYKYEPFGGITFKPKSAFLGSDTIQTTGTSSQLGAFLSTFDTSGILFSSATGPTQSFSGLSLVIQDVCSSTVMETLTYTVNIGAGRFLQPSNDQLLEFYRNEPIGNNVLFIGSIPISTPASTVSLPAGMGFVSNDICSYYLTGVPTIQSPASNYNILATGTPPNQSKIISTKPIIRVNPERLILNVSGTGIVSNLTVGTDICGVSVSGRCPPYNSTPPYAYPGGNIRYIWYPSLPDGLRFTDSAGTTLTNGGPASTSDSSSTIILRGSITSNAIKNLTSSNFDLSLTGIRVSSPAISNTTYLQLRFKETVVFDNPTVTPLYKDASVNSSVSSNSFFARTLFATMDGSISSITSSTLPAGTVLDFSSNAQRAFLKGTPTTVSSYTSTIRASNSNGVYADISVNFNVLADSVTFTSVPMDTCSAFVVTRSLSNAKDGYYSSPLQFTANSASGCNVTMRMTDLSGTGLTFTGTTGSNVTYTLSGTPSNTKSLTTATVTAEVLSTSTSNTTSFTFLILPEAYTFADLSINAIQNVAITPVYVTATTRSGNPVVWYSSTNLPSSLSIDTTGRISGTVLGSTNGTFNIIASTGSSFATSSNIPYYVTPDAIVLFSEQPSYTFDAGANVSIPITGLSYSGATVSNYRFSGLPATGLTIGSNSGLITGPLTDGVPPNPLLPPGTTPFDVLGSVGLRNGDVSATFTSINPIVNRTFLFGNSAVASNDFNSILYTSDTSDYFLGWTSNNTTYGAFNSYVITSNKQVSDFKIKNNIIDSNVFLATLTSNQVLRSIDGVTFSNVDLSASIMFSSIVNISNTSMWIAGGVDTGLGSSNVYTYLSTDDGLTWSNIARVGDRFGGSNLLPRQLSSSTPFTSAYPYLISGTTLAYKNGVLLIGGRGQLAGGEDGMSPPYSPSLMKSDSNATTWTIPSGDQLTTEIGGLNVDGSGVWIATGSTLYNTEALDSNIGLARTIVYSTDNGSSWTFGQPFGGTSVDSSGMFNYMAYNVAYGNGCWLAHGLSVYSEDGDNFWYPEIRSSSNGLNWEKVLFFDSNLFTITNNQSNALDQIQSIAYISNTWNVLVNKSSGGNYDTILCTHPDTSYGDISGFRANWSQTTVIPNLPTPSNGIRQTYRGFTQPVYVRTGTPTQAIIQFSNTTVGGPVFTSPSQSSYTFYQYMPIPTIQFSATGTGRVYLFVDSASLPVGLTWNPYTETITGKTVDVGTHNFSVYAKDDVGITRFPVSISTIVPRVVRQQTSAGAYTYLVKQYTEVNAAQNARDYRVNPTQDVPLGKFMANPAPDVITPSNCPC